MLMDLPGGGGGFSPFVVVVYFDLFLPFPRYLFLLWPDGFEKTLEPSSLFSFLTQPLLVKPRTITNGRKQ